MFDAACDRCFKKPAPEVGRTDPLGIRREEVRIERATFADHLVQRERRLERTGRDRAVALEADRGEVVDTRLMRVELPTAR